MQFQADKHELKTFLVILMNRLIVGILGRGTVGANPALGTAIIMI